jgi:hypothetical protein
LTEYILPAVLFFTGGVVQGAMGFGLAMVVVPPLLFFMPAAMVVPTICLSNIPNNTIAAWSLREKIQSRIVGLLGAGSATGLIGGVYLLKSLDGPPFKAFVGVLMVGIAGVLMSGWRKPLRNPNAALYPVGVLSGFLSGTIAISGPPVVLFLTNLDVDRDVFRANLFAYFGLTGSMTLIGFFVAGLLTWDIAVLALTLLPVAFIGTRIGLHLATRLHQAVFQRITLSAVATMGLILFLRNAAELI